MKFSPCLLLTLSTAALFTPLRSNAQNLFLNPSFETIALQTPPYLGQAYLPDHWTQVALTDDTYSVAGDFGLIPGNNQFGRWNILQTPADGGRFVAGGLDAESFGQTLTLQAGATYTVSAFIAADSATAGTAATWQVFLYDNEVAFSDFIAGSFTPVTAGSTWQFRSFNFTAPANAAVYEKVGFLTHTGEAIYMGIDLVSLSVVAIPEPSTYALWLGSVLLLIAVHQRRRAV